MTSPSPPLALKTGGLTLNFSFICTSTVVWIASFLTIRIEKTKKKNTKSCLLALMAFFLYLLATAVLRALADAPPYFNQPDFDAGAYGPYPLKTYVSTELTSPRANVLQSHVECDNGQFTLLTPRGGMVEQPSAMILDSHGNLVWSKGGYNQVYNMMAQEYKGQKYLTFWAGNDAVGGHGAGTYYMLDSSYQEVYAFGAANGLDADLHEFLITEDGTALITVYQPIPYDLSPIGGRVDGEMWDCIIQEIDIESGKSVFEWRASEHHALTETYRGIPNDEAFDWYHINSIDKDSKGNYLTSARYTHTVTYISGETGEILWVLGGKRNNFTDLSGGKATDFLLQHEARWQDDHNSITIFDNGAEDGHIVAEYSRGMRVAIDEKAMTATLLNEYINPNKIHGVSQGSLQVLSNGNVLLGYGNAAAMTEFARNGTVLCDVHFAPRDLFGSGDVQSYRIYKFDWVGHPITKPDVRLLPRISTIPESAASPVVLKTPSGGKSLFVSWNGATQVTHWVLEGTESLSGGEDEIEWEKVETVSKEGFETQLVLEEGDPKYIRLVGVDSFGTALGKSDVWNWADKYVSLLPVHKIFTKSAAKPLDF
jgi:hypothetical protein